MSSPSCCTCLGPLSWPCCLATSVPFGCLLQSSANTPRHLRRDVGRWLLCIAPSMNIPCVDAHPRSLSFQLYFSYFCDLYLSTLFSFLLPILCWVFSNSFGYTASLILSSICWGNLAGVRSIPLFHPFFLILLVCRMETWL